MWNFFSFSSNITSRIRNETRKIEIDLLKKGEIRERSKGEERLSVSGDRRDKEFRSMRKQERNRGIRSG